MKRVLLNFRFLILIAWIPFQLVSSSLVQSQTPSNSDAAAVDPPATLVVQLGHSEGVSSVAFSRDGRYVLTGGTQIQDQTARLWETETGRELRTFVGGPVAFSPDGTRVLIGNRARAREGNDSEAAASLVETTSGREVVRLEHSGVVASVAFSSDGKYVLTGSKNDGTARMWEAATGKELQTFRTQARDVRQVAFSPDLKHVLTVGLIEAILWDTETGKRLGTFNPGESYFASAFSPDGQYVMIVNQPGLVGSDYLRLWDVVTAKEVRRFGGTSRGYFDIAFSPDGKYVLTGGETAQLWEVATGREVWKSPDHGSIWAVAFSFDGKYVLTGSTDATARLWEVTTGKELRRFEGRAAGVESIAVSSNGKYLLTKALRNPNQSLSLWDLETGNQLRRFGGDFGSVRSVAFSADGRFVAIGGSNQVVLWESETGRTLKTFKGHTESVLSVAFSPDAKYLLTGGSDHTARLWDIETGQELQKFTGVFTYDKVNSVAFSSDGQYVLLAGYEWASLRSALTGEAVQTFRDLLGWVSSVAVSSDGRLVLMGGADAVGAHNYDPRVTSARLWDVRTGKELRRFNHSDSVWSVAFSHDGRYVLTGSQDRTARLWDTETGKELQRFVGHLGAIQSVAFSPDGNYVLTGSSDSTTRYWSLSTGAEFCRLISFKDGTWAVVDPEGRFDTNNLDDISGLHWIMKDDPMRPLPVEVFIREYYEPRLLARMLAREQFKKVRDISKLNRLQPRIEVTSIVQQANNPELVTVTVQVAKASGEFKRDQGTITEETGVYDVRLFRDNQIVGQSPDSSSYISIGQSVAVADLNQWRQNTRVKLNINGTQLITFRNIRLPRKPDLKEVEFSAYAFNEDRIKSRTDRRTFQIPNVVAPLKGRAYIISVGVNSFEDEAWNLQFAANDARLTQRVLLDKLKQSNNYEAVIGVTLISDAAAKQNTATKARFKAVLDLLSGKNVNAALIKAIVNADKIKTARPEDFVLISFSSHGYADSGGNFFLFPADIGRAAPGRIDQMKQRLISSDELSLWLKDVDAGEMVMIVDACHAAAAIEGAEFKPGPMGSRGLGQLSYDKGMRILTATQSANVAIEAAAIGHGLLTYALVNEGLEQQTADFKPRDRSINLREWLEYGTERVPKLYDEILSGKLKSINRAELAGAAGQSRRGSQQLPSLFDFALKKKDAVLVSLH